MLLYYVMCVMGKIVSYVLFLQLSHIHMYSVYVFCGNDLYKISLLGNLMNYLLNGSTILAFKVLYNQCNERFNVHVVLKFACMYISDIR